MIEKAEVLARFGVDLDLLSDQYDWGLEGDDEDHWQLPVGYLRLSPVRANPSYVNVELMAKSNFYAFVKNRPTGHYYYFAPLAGKGA